MSRLISMGFVIFGLCVVILVGTFFFLGVTGQDIPFMDEESKVEYEFKKKEIESEKIKEILED